MIIEFWLEGTTKQMSETQSMTVLLYVDLQPSRGTSFFIKDQFRLR